MFYKYEIKKMNNGDEVLYLYLSTKFEFSKELNYNDNENLSVLSRNFIKANNIPFKGNVIYLIVDDIITKKINITNNLNDVSGYYLPDNYLINIKLSDGALCEISLRDYLLSALFSKYSIELGDEVLKAICVLFNTYCFKCMSDAKHILQNNDFLMYRPYVEYRNVYKNFDAVVDRLNRIIDSCSGICLCYNGVFVLPFIHYSNSGRTLSNAKYPYLTSVKSLWDLTSNYYINTVELSFSKLNKLLDINITSASKVDIKNNGKTIVLGKNNFSIYEIKSKLGLKSNDISIIVNNNSICFICRGFGNGYGLSVYGATFIESNGGKYNNILGYYFPKCRLFQYVK